MSQKSTAEYLAQVLERRLASELLCLQDAMDDLKRGKLYRARTVATIGGDLAEIAGRIMALTEIIEQSP